MCGIAKNIFQHLRLPSLASTKRNLFFTQILHSHRADFTENRYNNGSTTQALCGVIPGQYRTKSVWRLCTPSACKFPVIFHKNAREYIKYSLRFLFHLTKNLTTHLPHNLCAVLPLKCICGGFLKNKRGQGTKPILMHLDDSGSTE